MSDQAKPTEREKEQEKKEVEKTSKYEIPRLDFSSQERKELEKYFTLPEGEEKANRKKELEKKFKPRIERYEKALDQELLTAPKSSAFEVKGSDEWVKTDTFSLLEREYARKKEGKSIPSREEMRILVNRLLSAQPRLKLFFEKHCILQYDPKALWEDSAEAGGATITTRQEGGRKKFLIQLDGGSFINEISTTDVKTGEKISVRYLDLNKISFILLRSLARLIPSPEKMAKLWAKTRKKKRGLLIDRNAPDDWTNFFNLCILDPDTAKRINQEAYEEFEKFMEKAELTPQFTDQKITIKDAKIDYDNLYENLEKQQRKSRWYERFNLSAVWDIVTLKWLVWREGIDWDERAKAEYDLKEVQRILARDEGIVQRDARFEELIMFNDKNNCRRLIMASAMTGDLRDWQLLLYAWKFDPIFQRTQGREISAETFFFFERTRRLSEKARRIATKPMWYYRDPKTGRYFRKDSEKYQAETNEEWAKKADRDSQGTAQETYEHMRSAKDGKFMALDARLGDNLDNPNSEGWYASTGDFRNILGHKAAKDFLTDMQNYAKAQGDMNWINKLEADQRGAIARFHITTNRGAQGARAGSAAARERNLYHEHTKPITRDAFLHYEHLIPSLEEESAKKSKELVKELSKESPEDFIRRASPEEISTVFRNVRKPGPTEEKEKTRKTARDISLENFTRIENKLRASHLPEKIRMFLLMKFEFLRKGLDKEEVKEPISVQTDKLKKEIDKLLENYPDFQDQTYQFLDDFLTELRKFRVIKEYQRVFKPYQEGVDRLEKTLKKETKDKIRNYYDKVLLKKLAAKEIDAEQATDEINEKFKKDNFAITPEEKAEILAPETAEEQLEKLASIVENELKRKDLPLGEVLNRQKEKIENLYQKVQEASWQPEEKRPLSEYLEDCQKIEASPKSVLENIKDEDDLLKHLGIIYTILNDRINRIERTTRRRATATTTEEASEELIVS